MRNYWAEHANHTEWKRDEVGMVNDVGLITIQYLRMQAGIDTSMPDKIIKRVVGREFDVHTNANDDLSFIDEMERLSKEIRYSQILICWAIWLRESDMGKGDGKHCDLGFLLLIEHIPFIYIPTLLLNKRWYEKIKTKNGVERNVGRNRL